MSTPDLSNQSTSSGTCRAQGRSDVEAHGGDQDHVARVSLLSLPNDLLLPIFQEVYEDKTKSVYWAPGIRLADILINRRIFSLTKPTWISRLIANRRALDKRLSKLLDDPARLDNLRRLSLEFDPDRAHLISLVLSRLPRLDHLQLLFLGPCTIAVGATLKSGIKRLTRAIRLRVSFYNCSGSEYDAIREQCFDEIFTGGRELWRNGDLIEAWDYDREGLLQLRSAGSGNPLPPSFSWNGIVSFEIASSKESGPPGVSLIESLGRGLRKSADISRPIPLRRLVLDVPPGSDFVKHGDLGSAHLTELFRLLALTQLERLGFTSLAHIPHFTDQHTIPSVKLLRISGPCTFKNATNFSRIPAFLSLFPSLSQLHLVGSKFFGESWTADAISRIDASQIGFQCPELSTLLLYLQTSTQVKIFTFKGEGATREIRWTRLEKEDGFARDCWTL